MAEQSGWAPDTDRTSKNKRWRHKANHGDALKEQEDCLICFEDFQHSRRVVTKCGHNSICANCVLRMRAVINNQACPFCKEESEAVVVLSANAGKDIQKRSLEDFDLNSLPRDAAAGMYFQSSKDAGHFRKMKSLFCPVCDKSQGGDSGKVPRFQSNAQLSAHLRSQHGRFVCDICVSHSHLFVSEYRLFKSEEELKQHANFGSLATETSLGTDPHPECKFCSQIFYDKDGLFIHLHREHFHCHICHRSGSQTFFANYRQLFAHFKKSHLICEVQECIEKKFVVFENEMDLRAHIITEHANRLPAQDRKKLAQIPMDLVFNDSDERRRRGGKHGTSDAKSNDIEDEKKFSDSFVIGSTSNPDRILDAPSAVDFPMLEGSAYGSVAGSMSWAARQQTKSAKPPEEFPALPSNFGGPPRPVTSGAYSSSSSRSTTSKVKNGPPPAIAFPALPTPSHSNQALRTASHESKTKQKKKDSKHGKAASNAWKDTLSIVEVEVVNTTSERPKTKPKAKPVLPSQKNAPITGDFPALPGSQRSAQASEFKATNSTPLSEIITSSKPVDVKLNGFSEEKTQLSETCNSTTSSRKSSFGYAASLTDSTSCIHEEFPVLMSSSAVTGNTVGSYSATHSPSSSRRSSLGSIGDFEFVQTIAIKCQSIGSNPHPKIIGRAASKRYDFLRDLSNDAASVLLSRIKNSEVIRVSDRKLGLLSRAVKAVKPDEIRDSLILKKLGLSSNGLSTLSKLLQLSEDGYSSVRTWARRNLSEMESEDLCIMCEFIVQFTEQ